MGLSACLLLEGFGAALVGTAGVASGCFLLEGLGAALVGLANCSVSSAVRSVEEAARLLCGSSLDWMGVRVGAGLFPTASPDGGGGGPCDELEASAAFSSLLLRRGFPTFTIWIVTVFGFLASAAGRSSVFLFLTPPGGGGGGGGGGVD